MRRLPFFDPEAAHALHHLLHLLELLQERIDLCGGRAAPVGDAQPARTVHQIGLAALVERHRPDDRLDPLQLVIVDLGVAGFLGEPGNHTDHARQRPHLLQLLHLLEEVVERELALEQLGGRGLGLLLLVDLLGLLDEAEDVAHAEDAARHAIGMELLEVGDLLARGGERDRLADDLLHRERRATAGVAVELRQDHAVDRERLVERLGDRDRVLAGHRVDDEERVVRLDGRGDLTDLLHHLGVDREAAGGVDDHDVAPDPAGLGDAAARRRRPGRSARRRPARRSGGRACGAARRRPGAAGRLRRGSGCDPAP